MKDLLEKIVPQNAPNRNSYIEQTLTLLNKSKGTQAQKEEAVVLYAPMMINFKNVAFMGNRMDLMANGWVEMMAKNGFKISAGIVLDGDEFSANMAGFTNEDTPPIEHKVKDFKDITWENIKVAYCFALDNSTGRFTAPEVITKKDLEKIKAKGNKVWNEFLGEMIKKSVIRRFIKRLGINDSAMNNLIEKWDEQHDMNKTISDVDIITMLKGKIGECSTLTEVGEVWAEINSKYKDKKAEVVSTVVEKLESFEQTERVLKTLNMFKKMLENDSK